VDHLLERREARVVSVELFEEDATECGLIGALLASGASAPIPGFGASDCRSGCPAHLLRVEPDQRGVG
jgi:Uri superfamily endonuclease